MPMLRILCLMLCFPLATWAADDYQHRMDPGAAADAADRRPQRPALGTPGALRRAVSRPSTCTADTSKLDGWRRHDPADDRHPATARRSRRRAVLVGVDPAQNQGCDAVQMTLEQIDLVKRHGRAIPGP